MAHSTRGGRRSHRPARDQIRLPLGETTPRAVVLLRSVEEAATPLRGKRFRRAKQLAIAVAFCSQPRCIAHWTELKRIANRDEQLFGKSYSTFKRACRDAAIFGLRSKGQGGVSPDHRWIETAVLMKLVERSNTIARAERTPSAFERSKDQKSEPSRQQSGPSVGQFGPSIAKSGPSIPYIETLSNSSSTTVEEAEFARLVESLRCKLDVKRAREAVEQALQRGCLIDQLRRRAQWFHDRKREWPIEHRGGAAYQGIADATPELPDHAGWPYRR